MLRHAAARLLALVLSLAIPSAAASIGYLELRLPPPKGTEGAPMAFFLAFPDTLGGFPVSMFLAGTEEQAKALLTGTSLTAKPLTSHEKNFLIGIRSLAEGRASEAHAALAAASKGLRGHGAPARLADCLRVDAALLLYLAGLPEEAGRDWRRVLEGGSSGAGEAAWRNLYALHLSRRDFAQAHRLVEEALQARPDNRWAHMAKGFLLRMIGSPEDWEDYLRKGSSAKDSLHGIQIAYGKFLADQGQVEEAVKYYARGLEGAPQNGPAWLELGWLYYRTGYLIFAEKCVHNSFRHGIADPSVFELFARILVDASESADTGKAMAGLPFGFDSAWGARLWRHAEKVVEEGFPKDLHNRGLAQLLYRIYCRNGKVDAARNLREEFWFHFTPPPPIRAPRLGRRSRPAPPAFPHRLSYVTYPLARRLQTNDFYEYF